MTIRTPIAALLLTLQVLAGGAVPLAHAGEPETAPAAIEAHHDASCAVLHDALRCVLCQYAGSLSTPPVAPGPATRLTVRAPCAHVDASREPRSIAQGGSRPRAPPTLLS